ncbi:hypothetical protein BpHYR1_052263 [Brachionus plicatilis]|uniref:Uncharacterized protein n=1 Tax=Brachionus plicatilis TaxID=10195 RepID=A0A3M7TA37_BRAPC|nr:hypothetical protein BpHYR1_052263 [Brachionus plicatilis]
MKNGVYGIFSGNKNLIEFFSNFQYVYDYAIFALIVNDNQVRPANTNTKVNKEYYIKHLDFFNFNQCLRSRFFAKL